MSVSVLSTQYSVLSTQYFGLKAQFNPIELNLIGNLDSKRFLQNKLHEKQLRELADSTLCNTLRPFASK